MLKSPLVEKMIVLYNKNISLTKLLSKEFADSKQPHATALQTFAIFDFVLKHKMNWDLNKKKYLISFIAQHDFAMDLSTNYVKAMLKKNKNGFVYRAWNVNESIIWV